MSKKRTSLESVFSSQKSEGSTPTETSTAPLVVKEKKKQQAVYLQPAVYEQLRTLAFEERRKMHDYLIEGLSLVFKNRGLKSVEELIKKDE